MKIVDDIQLPSATIDAIFRFMNQKQRNSQSDQCYESFRRQLMHGQLTPGSRLVEEKWAEHLGVSRGAVRESLKMLAHEGFLEVGDRGGFFVPVLDQAALDEVLEVRLAIETGALQLFEIHGIPEEGLARLRKACDLMEQLTHVGFEYGFAEADRMFHDILVEMAGNRRMLRIFRQAPLPLSPLPELEESGRRENMRRTLADHRQLCELLTAGQIAEARALLQRHLLVDHQEASRLVQNDVANSDVAHSEVVEFEEGRPV